MCTVVPALCAELGGPLWQAGVQEIAPHNIREEELT